MEWKEMTLVSRITGMNMKPGDGHAVIQKTREDAGGVEGARQRQSGSCTGVESARLAAEG